MTRKRFLARFLAILAAALFLLTSGLPVLRPPWQRVRRR